MKIAEDLMSFFGHQEIFKVTIYNIRHFAIMYLESLELVGRWNGFLDFFIDQDISGIYLKIKKSLRLHFITF